MNKKNITLLLSFLFVGLITTASAANPIYVNNEYTTSNAGTHIFGVNAFTTIKEGIDNVDIGGTIHVAHGVYKENIIIEKSLSLLGDGATTLYGAGKSSPTIDGGASTTPATITINGATKSISVIISNFSIINSGNGINVLQNAVVMITKNTISGYRKNGITFGPVLYPGYGGVRGVISNNSIIGAGPTTTISQNGIQVSENNAATIINNKISNHIYDVPDSFWASGILIHQSNNVFTSRNILSDNQAGINIMQGSYNKITNNTINGNSFTKAGITLNGSTNKELPTTNANSIEGNTISGGSVGIWASNTASTTYSNNIISSSTDNGIYSWNSDNSTFSKNTISKIHSPTNNAWGIVLDGDTVLSTTSSNVLSSNVIKTSDLGFWVGTSSYNNLLTNNIFNDKKVNTHLTVSGNYITSPVSSKEISILEKKGMVLGSTSFNFLKDLEVGNFGSDVTHLQELLITEGLLKTETTGYFGTETRNALIVWQKKNNLPTTGYFGVLTRNTINSKNK